MKVRGHELFSAFPSLGPLFSLSAKIDNDTVSLIFLSWSQFQRVPGTAQRSILPTLLRSPLRVELELLLAGG